MQSVKQLLLIWLFAFALLLGSAYNLYLSYDAKDNPDVTTYMNIANGNFKDQSLTRRYRIIVPFAAKVVSLPIEKVYAKLWKNRTENATIGALKLGFLIVNLLIMASAGLALYLVCRAYRISVFGSLLGMIAVLCGGRWGNIFAALPLTDSFYFLILVLTILGIKTRNEKLIAVCILFGFLAKESFVFVAPLIFFFASMKKWKQLILFGISAVIVFAMRYKIDQIAGSASTESLANDAKHFDNILTSIKRILSVRGIGELATVLGVFSFILLAGFTKGKEAIKSWTSHIDLFLWCFIPVLILHALLSEEVARMLYFGGALWAVMIGLIWDKHPFFKSQ
ncbi:MAG TPA: hypothetical protein VGB95_07090 [Chitinophagales bacterium]